MTSLSSQISFRVNPLFWLLVTFIGWISTGTVIGTVIWAIVIFISVSIHEFGHALTAVAFGHRADIELVAMGGVTRRQGPTLAPWKEFLVVFNGPLAGFSLGFLSLLVYQLMSQGGGSNSNLFLAAVQVSVLVNFFWTIVNLMPILPLDGGQLLRIVLEKQFGVGGIKATYFISMLLGAALSLGAILAGQFIMGAIFFMFTFEGYRNWSEIRVMGSKDRDEDLQNRFKRAEGFLAVGQLDQAYDILKDVRERAQKGILYLAATEYMAMILAQEGKSNEAYALLINDKGKISSTGLQLLHQLAFRTEHWQEVVALGNQIYQELPRYDIALINAMANAKLGNVVPAVGWLQTSIDQGLPDVKGVLQRIEFDRIRGTPEFESFCDR